MGALLIIIGVLKVIAGVIWVVATFGSLGSISGVTLWSGVIAIAPALSAVGGGVLFMAVGVVIGHLRIIEQSSTQAAASLMRLVRDLHPR